MEEVKKKRGRPPKNAVKEPKAKLPGIFEVRRIGTHGFVFASFASGVQFWVQFSKTTDRSETIDLFDAHKEQYPWNLGKEIHSRGQDKPVWEYQTVEGLQYLHNGTGKIYEVASVERVLDEAKSKEQGRQFYQWFVFDTSGKKIQAKTGEGLFGQLKEDCVVPNVQEVNPEAARALWPNRTVNLSNLFAKGNVFEKMGMKPVAIEQSGGAREEKPIDGAKIAGVKSGKLDKEIIGTFTPGQ